MHINLTRQLFLINWILIWPLAHIYESDLIHRLNRRDRAQKQTFYSDTRNYFFSVFWFSVRPFVSLSGAFIALADHILVEFECALKYCRSYYTYVAAACDAIMLKCSSSHYASVKPTMCAYIRVCHGQNGCIYWQQMRMVFGHLLPAMFCWYMVKLMSGQLYLLLWSISFEWHTILVECMVLMRTKRIHYCN